MSTGPEWILALAEVLRSIAWPTVALAAMLRFKDPMGRLLDRLRKGGPAEFDPLPTGQPSASDPLVIEAAAAQGATPPITRTEAISEMEQLIAELPLVAQQPTAEARASVLLTLSARAVLMGIFESYEATIWASQIALLEFLNSRPDGVELSDLRTSFYEPAAVRYPAIYPHQSFERYIGFLEEGAFVRREGTRLRITPRGFDYLTWRVGQRKTPKTFG